MTHEALVVRVARLVDRGSAEALAGVPDMSIEEVRAAICDREEACDALRGASAAERKMSMPPLLRDLFYLTLYEAFYVIVAAEQGIEVELRPGQDHALLEYLMGKR